MNQRQVINGVIFLLAITLGLFTFVHYRLVSSIETQDYQSLIPYGTKIQTWLSSTQHFIDEENLIAWHQYSLLRLTPCQHFTSKEQPTLEFELLMIDFSRFSFKVYSEEDRWLVKRQDLTFCFELQPYQIKQLLNFDV
ncbi:MAG: hypothetical protein AAGB12_00495 [Pseudomonadota bacterium]